MKPIKPDDKNLQDLKEKCFKHLYDRIRIPNTNTPYTVGTGFRRELRKV